MRERLTFSTKLSADTHGEPIVSYTPGDTVRCALEQLPGKGLFAALARLESDVRLAAHVNPHASAVRGNRARIKGVDYDIYDLDDSDPDRVVLVLKEVVRDAE